MTKQSLLAAVLFACGLSSANAVQFVNSIEIAGDTTDLYPLTAVRPVPT